MVLLCPLRSRGNALNEMIQNGRHKGWGIFIKDAGEEKLISYIDKKILKPSEDEDHLTQIHTGTQIGFAAKLFQIM